MFVMQCYTNLDNLCNSLNLRPIFVNIQADMERVMVTLIDDGFAEEDIDDFISSLEVDQHKIINMDDINVTIEDPGYLLEEPPEASNEPKEYTSSYKKQSFTLPVTFFDISRNVSLLQRCRPISVKVVDCGIHPWYYKDIKRRSIKNRIIYEEDNEKDGKGSDAEDSEELDKDEETSKQAPNSDDAGFLLQINDTCDKELLCSTSEISASKISLSPEQSVQIFNIRKEIENQINVENLNNNILGIVEIDNNLVIREEINKQNLSLIESGTVQAESIFNKDSERNDFLTYKAIAETIVRSIDHRDINVGTNDSKVVKEIDITKSGKGNEDIQPLNVSQGSDVTKEIKVGESCEKLITSPIIPCRVESRKKIKEKEKTSTKSTNIYSNLKICCNLNNSCNRLISTANKIIPHYHCKPAVPVSSLRYENYYMETNPIKSQHNITTGTVLDYVDQNGMVNKYPQHELNKKRCVMPLNTVHSNSLDSIPTFYSNPITYNTTHLSSSNKQKDFNNNMKYNNPITHTCNWRPHFNYSGWNYPKNGHASSSYSTQVTKENGMGAGNVRGTNISKESYRVISQHTNAGYSPFAHKSVSSFNQYVTSPEVQYFVQPTVSNTQNNPLLTQLLNQSSLAPEYYSSKQRYTQSNNCQYPTGTRYTNSNLRNGNNYMYEYRQPPNLYAGYSSNPSSTLEVNTPNINHIKKNKANSGRSNVQNSVSSKNNVNGGRINKKVKADKGVKNLNPFTSGSSKSVAPSGRIDVSSMIIALKPKKNNVSLANKSSPINYDNVAALENIRQKRYDKPVINEYVNKEKHVAATAFSQYTKNCVQKNRNPEKATADINGCSAAISPILTFDKSSEMWSKLKRYDTIDITNG